HAIKEGRQFFSGIFVQAPCASVEDAEDRALCELCLLRNVGGNLVVASRQVQRRAILADQLAQDRCSRPHMATLLGRSTSIGPLQLLYNSRAKNTQKLAKRSLPGRPDQG